MTYEDFRAGELQGWDARADAYDMATARATVQSIPDLLATVRFAAGMRLLDFCCGPGRIPEKQAYPDLPLGCAQCIANLGARPGKRPRCVGLGMSAFINLI